MPTYLDEKRRRIGQFAEYLRLMGLRAHKVVKDSCFHHLRRSASRRCRVTQAQGIGGDQGRFPGRWWLGIGRVGRCRGVAEAWQTRENVVPAISNLPSCGTAFTWNCPTTRSFPRRPSRFSAAAWDSTGRRTGLTFVGSGPTGRTCVKWEPLQKVYLYRDEESAAEDMAFILFQIWHFPVDSPLYVKAASFHTKHRFEHGKRID